MKRYVITTGLIFGLVTLAHLARMVVERPLATDPAYWLVTAAVAGLAGWAGWLLRRDAR